MRGRAGRITAAMAIVVVAVGCRAPDDADERAATPTAGWGASSGTPSPVATTPAVAPTLIATATVDQVEVFDTPDAGGEPVHVLAHPTDVGAPRVFLIEQRREEWLEVLLPVRPNGSTGWIRSSDVDLTRTSYRVEVDLSAFRLQVLDGQDVVIDTEIGYGADDTPTPGGEYFVTELLRPPDADGVYGPYAFGLSGFSDVHRDFAGGEGVIGIHGTNDPDSIGSRVSNGCIRIDNATVSRMAGMLPLGTPVTIVG